MGKPQCNPSDDSPQRNARATAAQLMKKTAFEPKQHHAKYGLERAHPEHKALPKHYHLGENQQSTAASHNATTDHSATGNVTTDLCTTHKAQRAHKHRSPAQRPTRNGWANAILLASLRYSFDSFNISSSSLRVHFQFRT